MPIISLQKAVYILLLIFFSVAALIYAKPFLVPVMIAALLAMLFMPLCRLFERKGLHKAIAIIICVLILLSGVAGVIWLVSSQVADLANDADKIEQNVTDNFEKLKQYISNTLGISQRKQQEMVQQQRQSAPGKLSGMVTQVLKGFGSFLTDFILTIVYIFLFLFYRSRLKAFALKIVDPENRAEADQVLTGISKVTQKYLTGLAIMIVILWVMYGIGFSIVGVKNAIFFAILCGLLEIVPFVGNLFGTLLTVVVSFAQGGDTGLVLGILITYGVVQFVQTYLLEPLVVGAEVSINPIATIIGLVAGEQIWGIPGMILAIPIIGIMKIVFDHITPLKPYGFLLGEEKKKKGKKNDDSA